jgi:hypothetical protein
MSARDGIADESGESFRTAVGFGFQDAQLRRLRYHLLRLTAIEGGLTHDDIRDLCELGRLALGESVVTEEADSIKERPESSPLAEVPSINDRFVRSTQWWVDKPARVRKRRVS